MTISGPEPTEAHMTWHLCPNEPRCGHGAALHDIEDMEDDRPRCTADGCDCGGLVLCGRRLDIGSGRLPTQRMIADCGGPKGHDGDCIMLSQIWRPA